MRFAALLVTRKTVQLVGSKTVQGNILPLFLVDAIVNLYLSFAQHRSVKWL